MLRSNLINEVIRRALDAAGIGRRMTSRVPRPRVRPTSADDVATGGDFLALTHTSTQGSRDYRLYVPSGYDGSPMPLIVMLHGCKQNPLDFAAGTRMNEQAERHGLLVAYPAQTARANGANCWNWFEPAQQVRGGVEPALIAGMVGDIAASYTVQPRRVYVAGLSAGAAMAMILGRAYPDVFAGVAVHSGLPAGAAHDVGSAFAAMRGLAAMPRDDPGTAMAVRTIVFHGDADATVASRNGAAVVTQAVAAFERDGERLQRVIHSNDAAGGRECTTTLFIDADGRPLVEEWVVHGARHAWSGGSSAGSFTDARGPDASAEIVRFFLDA